MTNTLVKFNKNYEYYEYEGWHGVISIMEPTTCCGITLYEAEIQNGIDYKEVKRGGITCSICLNAIQQHKNIKL